MGARGGPKLYARTHTHAHTHTHTHTQIKNKAGNIKTYYFYGKKREFYTKKGVGSISEYNVYFVQLPTSINTLGFIKKKLVIHGEEVRAREGGWEG